MKSNKISTDTQLSSLQSPVESNDVDDVASEAGSTGTAKPSDSLLSSQLLMQIFGKLALTDKSMEQQFAELKAENKILKGRVKDFEKRFKVIETIISKEAIARQQVIDELEKRIVNLILAKVDKVIFEAKLDSLEQRSNEIKEKFAAVSAVSDKVNENFVFLSDAAFSMQDAVESLVNGGVDLTPGPSLICHQYKGDTTYLAHGSKFTAVTIPVAAGVNFPGKAEAIAAAAKARAKFNSMKP